MNEYDHKKIDSSLNPLIKDGVKDDLAKVKRALYDPMSELCFKPSKKLIEILARGEHPVAKKLPDGFKAMLISGVPHAIQKRMVFDLLAGKLDPDNSFILVNGDIIVRGNKTLMSEGKANEKGN